MTKVYRVSLAMHRTMNYEVRNISAKSKKEAFALALQAWEHGEGYVDDDWGNDALAIEGKHWDNPTIEDFPKGIPKGVYIAEVDIKSGEEKEV